MTVGQRSLASLTVMPVLMPYCLASMLFGMSSWITVVHHHGGQRNAPCCSWASPAVWRQLCDIPFGTLYGLFARWTRLGLWRRLLSRLRRAWRHACGDAAEPSAVVIDNRT